jgi:hypothetical protein
MEERWLVRRHTGERPVNRKAAAAIVALWLSLAALAILFVARII